MNTPYQLQQFAETPSPRDQWASITTLFHQLCNAGNMIISTETDFIWEGIYRPTHNGQVRTGVFAEVGFKLYQFIEIYPGLIKSSFGNSGSFYQLAHRTYQVAPDARIALSFKNLENRQLILPESLHSDEG
jgi:hypothetical protein